MIRHTHSLTRHDVLQGTSTYPPISVNVAVGAHAPTQVSITTAVTGGGSASNTVLAETSVH